MMAPSSVTAPLQFKQTSLVRKKIKHPIHFPQYIRHNNIPSNSEEMHKYDNNISKSTKFSFRTNSFMSVDSNINNFKSAHHL